MKPPVAPPLVFLIVFLAFVTSTLRADFNRPSAADRAFALGDISAEPAPLRLLLEPDGDFYPITLPRPNDWLSQHYEPGQTFAAYCASKPNRPDAIRRTIYLLPIGDFDEDTSPPLAEIREYAAAYFQLPVKILPAYYPHDLEFDPRNNPRSGNRQILTTSVEAFLKARLPADAYCLLGVTMTDLYPSPKWNYVFGEATLTDRVGIYSFARYDPAFWGNERGSDYHDLILRRACKVMTHELGHMFGLDHCIYFDCLMNGANHLEEMDGTPRYVCPICLRKLHECIGFDAVKRYQQILAICERHQWYNDVDWINHQLAKVRPADAPPPKKPPASATSLSPAPASGGSRSGSPSPT